MTESEAPQTQPASDLPPQYRAADVEPAITRAWNDARAWHAAPGNPGNPGSPGKGGKPYSIVIPPPNVTAALHMGHALNNTLQDVLTRYHRMRGDNAMWMPGTDHAGIATQTVVDKRLQAEGQKSLKDYKRDEAEGKGGRDEFIGKVQAWKDEYEGRITDQLKAMGCSCDWDRQRFTMDEQCAAAVREAFFQLFKDGLIYRGKRLVNWDPVTGTALADDEVEMQEVDGNFYYMKYPIAEGSPESSVQSPESGEGDAGRTGDSGLGTLDSGPAFVTVATTRPETMLGDTAVAVNPKDPKNAHLIGRYVRLPIVGRVVPIIGDDYVVIPDPESGDAKAKFASGFLKVTPAHDPNDYEIGRRHDLPTINVMAPDASISLDHGWAAQEPGQRENAELKPFLGLSREDARREIVKWFKAHDLMEEVRPYRHSVGHSYRSHVPVEPYLSDQWYIAVKKVPASLESPKNRPIPGTDVPGESLAGFALRALADDQRTGDSAVLSRGQNLRDSWEGGLRFTPERYAKTFQQWHEGIRDWCISRQLWWGHRIPVWTGETQKISKAENAENAVVREENGRTYVCLRQDDPDLIAELEAAGFEQDPDVLDTWFSSGLWPLSTMGWPGDTPELRTWNPTDVLCTAREIITLWVSRMVMFNLYFKGQLPFKDVFIHAMIQDGHGQKMSKSLGNGVDPLDIIESHGSDAMRFTLASMTTQTQDVRMPVDVVDPFTGEAFTPEFKTLANGYKVAAPVQERNGRKFASSYGVASGEVKPSEELPAARNTSEKFDYGRNFANKLWNAVRFALSNLKEGEGASPLAGVSGGGNRSVTVAAQTGGELGLADRWILSRLARTVAATEAALAEYRFADYAQTLYDFFWRDLCDWYIEAVKPTVAGRPAQRAVLAACIDASLRLLHPVMPFITERLWAALNAAVPRRELGGLSLPPSELLMTAPWPVVPAQLVDERAEAGFGHLQAVVTAIRQVRTTYKVPPRASVEVSSRMPAELAKPFLEHRSIAEALAGFIGREIGPNAARPADAAVAVVGDIEIYVHGLVDAATERPRLQKRLDELQKQVGNLRGRLSNEAYLKKAPEKLVNESREALAAAEREAEAVRKQLDALN